MRLFLFAILFASAAPPSFASEPIVVRNFDRPMWDETHAIEFTETLRIGGDDEDSEVFSQMVSIAVNSRGEIITADYNQNTVRRYDAEGNFLGPVGRGGEGPGEYRYVMAISVDSKDNIYVAGSHRISIFDATGKYVSDFRDVSDSMPRGVRVLADGSVLLSEFDRPTKTTLQKYKNGKHMMHFCEAFKPEGPYAEEVLGFAAGGYIDIGPDGMIYYTQMTPYEIRKFTPACVLVMQVFRENDFITPPRVEKQGDGMVFHAFAGSNHIFVLPDGKLLNSVITAGEPTGKSVLDLFDENGRLLYSQRFDHPFSPRWLDAAGNVYSFDRDVTAVVRSRMTIR